MAVTIKNKGKATSKVKAPTSTKGVSVLKIMADEYGDLSEEITVLQADPAVSALLEAQKKQGYLKDQIKELADKTLDKEEKLEAVGKKHTLVISAKGNESKVKAEGGKEAIFAFLGEETFVELCSFSITQLRAYLNPKQLEEVLATTRTKSRTLKLK